MKTSAYKSWTAEVEVELKNNIEVHYTYPSIEVHYSYPSAYNNGRLVIRGTSTEHLQDAERAVREIVEGLAAAL